MRKKIIITSSIVLFLGILGCSFVLFDQVQESNVKQRQQLHVEESVDRLISGGYNVQEFASSHSQQELKNQQSRLEQRRHFRNNVFTVSLFAVVAGSLVAGWYSVLGLAHLVIYIYGKASHWSCRFVQRKFHLGESPAHIECAVLDNPPILPKKDEAKGKGRVDEIEQDYSDDLHLADVMSGECETDTAVLNLLSDENPSKRGSVAPASGGATATLREPAVSERVDYDPRKDSLKFGKSLKSETSKIEKQLKLFQGQAKTQSGNSDKINETLVQLNEQVGAIREYASHQQERMAKLQNGYDWNIIRTFCLRVIRCIDNIEKRIDDMGEAVDDVGLDEVRDELLFALESSGIEQFTPEPGSDYRGQEKRAEAVRARCEMEDTEMKGKIAEVLRPGYQYLIDEENIKVIRAAQVKLYG